MVQCYLKKTVHHLISVDELTHLFALLQQVASNSVLASLYSSEGSVMERHHLAQAMCILNTDGCNILESLSQADYTKCLDLFRDIILGELSQLYYIN